jgi:hypothetical protein
MVVSAVWHSKVIGNTGTQRSLVLVLVFVCVVTFSRFVCLVLTSVFSKRTSFLDFLVFLTSLLHFSHKNNKNYNWRLVLTWFFLDHRIAIF